jgi:plasmid replication initiation protein
MQKEEVHMHANAQYDSNYLAVTDNRLINARYKMTALEQKIFLLAVSQIERGDEDFKEYKIAIKDYKHLLDNKNENPYDQVKKAARRLMERVLYVQYDDGDWVMLHMVNKARYQNSLGQLTIVLEDDLKPYLLDLKRRFTAFDTRYIIKLQSSHSIRIYELLKQYYNHNREANYCLIDLNELKELLGVQGNYKRYFDFKKRVLIQAQEELKANTDLFFEIEEIREGRVITKINFKIFSASDNGQLELFSPNELQVKLNGLSDERLQLYHALLEFDLGHDKALRYARDKRVEVLESAIESTKGQAKSEKGFTHSANQFITYLLEKDAVSGKSTYERKQEEEKERAKQERERIFKARKEGNRLYKLFQQEIDKQIDELVAQATEEEIQQVREAASGFELRVMLNNGEVDTSTMMFRVGYLRNKKQELNDSDEDFKKWALEEHKAKVERYKLTGAEEVIYQGKLDNEGWGVEKIRN